MQICEQIEDERSFGFVRVYTGDELSRRAKFAFITWLGHSVSALKRAKVSIDKSLVKEVISVSGRKTKNIWLTPRLNKSCFAKWQNFAVEILTSELVDLEEDVVRDLVVKAGGANYGTGSR